MRPGRKIDLNIPGLEAITLIVTGEVKVLHPEAELDAETGELLPGKRQTTLVQFFSDFGWRTVDLAHITVR